MRKNTEKIVNDFEYYRNNYFLDPNGSNIDLLANNATKMLSALLESYTGQKVKIPKVKITRQENGTVKISGDLTGEVLKQLKGLSYDPLKMPEEGHTLDDTVNTLSDLLKKEIKFNERFSGQMHPHDSILSYVAGIAGKFLNGNTIVAEVSPVVSYMEAQTVSWLANEFGFTPDQSWLYAAEKDPAIHEMLKKQIKESKIASGNMTSGGTTANYTALLVARNKANKNVNKHGIAKEKEEMVILGSEYSHYSLEKLCGYAGIGTENFLKVGTGKDKRINAADNGEKSLRTQMWNAAKNGKKVAGVFATAGTTELGEIDDLQGIGKLIDEFEQEFKYRPHFHVDAAHGGGFVMHKDYSPKKGGKFAGIEKADSITIDPHKMLYTHYSAGSVLFKDKKDHILLKQEAGYLFKNDGKPDFGQYRVEGSMGLEAALQTWTTLYGLGRKGLEAIQQHSLEMTQYLKQQLMKEANIELMNDPKMNLLCFRYNNPACSEDFNNEVNRDAQKTMYERGLAYISNERQLHRKTEDDDRHVDSFRAVMMHPWTEKKDIDQAIYEVKHGIREKFSKIHDEASKEMARLDGVKV